MNLRALISIVRALAFVVFFAAGISIAGEPLIWRLRDTDLRWAKDEKSWERIGLRLARSPSVDLHLGKVDSAKAVYFEAVVAYGDKVIEHCLLLLRGREAEGKHAESFVLMTRLPYEGTGDWEFASLIIEPPDPKAPGIEAVLPVVPQTSQADIWKMLEDFKACPSVQSKEEQFTVVACVIFEDAWRPFLEMTSPSKTSDPFGDAKPLDESKLTQPKSKEDR